MKVILEVRSPEAEQQLCHLKELLLKFIDKTDTKLNILHDQISIVEKRTVIIMATLDDVLTDVQEESTVLDSIGTLIAGLKQQVLDALSGVSLPPAVQAKVDAVFAVAEANKAKAAAAVLAGTPVDPSQIPTTPPTA